MQRQAAREPATRQVTVFRDLADVVIFTAVVIVREQRVSVEKAHQALIGTPVHGIYRLAELDGSLWLVQQLPNRKQRKLSLLATQQLDRTLA